MIQRRVTRAADIADDLIQSQASLLERRKNVRFGLGSLLGKIQETKHRSGEHNEDRNGNHQFQ